MAMKYWSSSRPRPPPPPPPPPEKKIHVKVKSLKLEGLRQQISIFDKNKKNPVMVVAMKWKEGSSSSSKQSRKNFSTRTHVRNGEVSSVKWDDEFENVVSAQNDMFDRWDVSFSVLYGENNETNNNKLAILGKVSLNLAEIAASMMEAWIERKIPINLKIAGVTTEATLSVSMNFVEIRNFKDSSKIIHQNSTHTNKEDGFGFGFFTWMTGYIPSKKNKLKKKKKKTANKQQNNKVSSCDSDESPTFDSVHNMIESKFSTQVNQIQKIGFLKRRRLSFGQTRTERKQPDIEKIDNDGKAIHTHLQNGSSSSVDSLASVSRQELNETETTSSKSDYKDENCTTASTSSSWEVKEIISRDGLTKLKTNVFFASFDQCSQEAAGESACTSLAAVIAHWLLQSNQQALMPTRSEFDTLITDGSSEWRKLCDNIKAVDPTNCCFQDKHFDLETVLEAGHLMRPLHVVPEKSFIGFFSPEKFESLKGAMSFDEIWNKIDTNIMEKYEQQPRIYIVSWNDHFFVLKVEADACYIIDTLGERLFEGCKKGYMLKFDDSSALMYNGNAEKEQSGSGEIAEIDTTNYKGGKDKTICTGRECCREFIKRFLAAIPVKELEEEQKKGTFSNLYLLQHLQIEFQYTSSSAAPSSSSSSSSSSSPATSSMSSLF